VQDHPAMGSIRNQSVPASRPPGDRKPAKCISCNGCFKPGLEEGGIYCVVEKKNRKRRAKVNHFQNDEKHRLSIMDSTITIQNFILLS